MAENGDRTTALQGSPGVALQEALRAIRRHLPRVLFTTAVVLMLGYGLTMLWPSKYESSTLFVLRDWHIIDEALAAELSDIGAAKKLLTLQGELRSAKRISAAMSELQWSEWQDTAGKDSDRRKLMRKLAENLTVGMDAGPTGASDIIIKFAWTHPAKARDFVNRLRDNWITLVLEGDKQKKEEALSRQEKVVQDRDAEHQKALAARKTYELDNKTPQLSDQTQNNLVKAQLTLEKTTTAADHEAAVSDVARLEGELALIPREIDAPIKPGSPEQAAALARLTTAQENLRRMSDPVTGYTELSPKRISAQREHDDALAAAEKLGPVGAAGIEKQTNEKYYLKGQELSAAKTKESTLSARARALQKELDETQQKLDALPAVTQQLSRLQADIDTAAELRKQAMVELAPLRERVAQLRSMNVLGTDASSLDAQGSSPIEILETAVEADEAVLPIGAIIMAVALVIGLAIGVLGPVLGEMTRSSFGTVREVSRTLGVPVLGAVDMILTARDARARTLQHTLTWATMLLVLISLATALYIYQSHPEVLPSALLRTLRDVKMALT